MGFMMCSVKVTAPAAMETVREMSDKEKEVNYEL